MNSEFDNNSLSAKPPSDSILTEVLRHVPDGVLIDAEALIRSCPEIKDFPSLMVDIAYEDYWRRLQQDGSMDVAAFVEKFPEIRERLAHMIDVGKLIHQAPDLFLSLLQPQWPEVPGRLGNFELIRQIGKGSFSRVYVARDVSLARRLVTIKITQHVVREAEALGSLQHECIVSPLGLYDALLPGLCVLCMPFNGRATLADVIQQSNEGRRSPASFDLQSIIHSINAELEDSGDVATSLEAEWRIPPLSFVKTVAWLGAQLAQGLAYAHGRGIYHCDVKPSNILLRPSGQPLLLDFNLSSSPQKCQFAGGTLAYMAPEQFRGLGKGSAASGAVDVFSLGATLIEMIQGFPPFGRSFNTQSPVHPLEDGSAPFLFDVDTRKRIGKACAALLESCVHLDPNRRPTADSLAVQLAELSGSRTTRRRSISAALAVAGLSVACLFTLTDVTSLVWRPPFDESMKKGIAALVSGDQGSTAVRHLRHANAAAPGRDDAKLLLACAHIQAAHWEQAAISLRQLSEETSDPEIHALLAYAICRWDRHYEVAELEYQKAYDAGLRRLDVLNNLTYCLIRTGKTDQAGTLLQQAREVSPDVLPVLLNELNYEVKKCWRHRQIPSTELADTVISNPALQRSPEAVAAGLRIYWLAAFLDENVMERAIAYTRNCVGTEKPLLDFLAVAKTVTSARSINLPDLFESAVPFSLQLDTSKFLIAPPVQEIDYLQRIVQTGLPRESTAMTAQK